MPLNHFQFDLSMVQTGVEQAHGEFMFPGAAVEAVAELVEIFLKILGRYAVIGTEQKGFQVTDGDMHPGQPLTGLIRRRHPSGVMLGFTNR